MAAKNVVFIPSPSEGTGPVQETVKEKYLVYTLDIRDTRTFIRDSLL